MLNMMPLSRHVLSLQTGLPRQFILGTIIPPTPGWFNVGWVFIGPHLGTVGKSCFPLLGRSYPWSSYLPVRCLSPWVPALAPLVVSSVFLGCRTWSLFLPSLCS